MTEECEEISYVSAKAWKDSVGCISLVPSTPGGIAFDARALQLLEINGEGLYDLGSEIYEVVAPEITRFLQNRLNSDCNFEGAFGLSLRCLIDSLLIRNAVINNVRTHGYNFTVAEGSWSLPVPETTQHLTFLMARNDGFNALLCSSICQKVKEPPRLVHRKLVQSQSGSCPRQISPSGFVVSMCGWALRFLKRKRYCFFDVSYLSVLDVVSLYVLSCGRMVPLLCVENQIPWIHAYADNNVRSSLRRALSHCESDINEIFDNGSVLLDLIAELLPASNLEGVLKNFAFLQSLSTNITGTYFSQSHYLSGACQLLMCLGSKASSKRLLGQHGGHYGLFAWSSWEWVEKRIAHRFLTYGWNDSTDQTLAIGHPRFGKKVKRVGLASKLLYLTNTMPFYNNICWSNPTSGSELQTYNSYKFEIAKTVTATVNNPLVIRLPKNDYGEDTATALQQRLPKGSFQIDLNSVMWRSIAESCLNIVDNNHTVLLELLSADVPTVGVWADEIFPYRADAALYIKKLKKVGIIQNSISGLHTHLYRLTGQDGFVDYEKICAWWRMPETREARSEFVKQYAYFNPNWRRELLYEMCKY